MFVQGQEWETDKRKHEKTVALNRDVNNWELDKGEALITGGKIMLVPSF